MMPEPAPQRWAEMTGPTIRAVFSRQPRTVSLIPVGATEQHGPHLPTGTDTILACALSDALSIATGAVVLPPSILGASWWHGTTLPGTLAASGEEVGAAAVTTAVWAAHSGARRLLFVNGHVGNTTGLSLACDRLRFEHPELRVGVLEWWRLGPEVDKAVTLDAVDWHANRAETSLMLAVAPSLVDVGAAADGDDDDRTEGLVFRYAAAQLSRTGVTGRPSEATVEEGQELWELVVAAATDLVRRAMVEEAPLR
jgi:creatinine amidohydrolase